MVVDLTRECILREKFVEACVKRLNLNPAFDTTMPLCGTPTLASLEMH